MELLSRDRTICGGLFVAQRVRNRRLTKPNTVVIRRAGYATACHGPAEAANLTVPRGGQE
jgi:hypothetical protein